MNGYINSIALYAMDDTDINVIQQMLANHPERIQAVEVDSLQTLNSGDFQLCITPQATDGLETQIACLYLPGDKVRVGTLIDKIETALLQNRYDDISHRSYHLDWDQSVLHYDGHTIPLTERERYLIAEIMNGGDDGRNKEFLLNRIWGYRADLETHTLETHIYRLRQKIEDEPESPKRLISIEGGYKLA